jgi:DNA-binding NarL/FixJ family response regulator
MAKLRILLGDDHTIVRQGLRKILETQPEWSVVAEASDGREAVRQTLTLQPEVAILDIGMPRLNGIEATRQIVRRLPNIAVVILSMHSDEPYIIQALQAGARAYLLKDSADTDLIRGVAAAAAGKSFFSPPGSCSTITCVTSRRRASSIDTNRSPSANGRSSSLLPKGTATRPSPIFSR